MLVLAIIVLAGSIEDSKPDNVSTYIVLNFKDFDDIYTYCVNGQKADCIDNFSMSINTLMLCQTKPPNSLP